MANTKTQRQNFIEDVALIFFAIEMSNAIKKSGVVKKNGTDFFEEFCCKNPQLKKLWSEINETKNALKKEYLQRDEEERVKES